MSFRDNFRDAIDVLRGKLVIADDMSAEVEVLRGENTALESDVTSLDVELSALKLRLPELDNLDEIRADRDWAYEQLNMLLSEFDVEVDEPVVDELVINEPVEEEPVVVPEPTAIEPVVVPEPTAIEPVVVPEPTAIEPVVVPEPTADVETPKPPVQPL